MYKNVARFNLDKDLKIILLDHRINYEGVSSMMNNIAKSFDTLVKRTSLRVFIRVFLMI